MRLYPRREGTSVVQHAGARYEAAADGGFDFPGDISDCLHSFAVKGEPLWEDAIERQRRLIAEEQARRADPRTLLDAVEQLIAQAEGTPAKTRTKASADK